MIGYHRNRLGQRGFSLLETLIAAILLAVGLLSLAALQAKALQASHNSYQRSVAVSQAYDAVERLWTGICVLDTTGVVSQIQTDWQTAHRNTAGMNWIVEGATGVATGTGSRIVQTTGNVFNIFVVWQDTRFDNSPITFSYTTILPTSASVNCPP